MGQSTADIAKMPLVSVIIPAHNPGVFFAEALASVYLQVWQGIPAEQWLEVIVVDDGSTPALNPSDFAAYPVRWIRNVAAMGAGAARNQGVKVARARWLAFLDADDVWLPHRLSAQLYAADRLPEQQLFYSEYRFWHANTAGDYSSSKTFNHLAAEQDDSAEPEWLLPVLLFDSDIHSAAALIDRSLFNKLGGFAEHLAVGEDYSLWLRAAGQLPIVKLTTVGMLYRQNPAGISRKPSVRAYEYELVKEAIARGPVNTPAVLMPSKAALKKRLARLAFSHGWRLANQGEQVLARHWFLTSIRHRPVAGKTWLHWLQALTKSTIQRASETSTSEKH